MWQTSLYYRINLLPFVCWHGYGDLSTLSIVMPHIAMLSLDKLPYLRQQTSSSQYHPDKQTRRQRDQGCVLFKYKSEHSHFIFWFTNVGATAPRSTSNQCPMSAVLLMKASNPLTLACRQAYHSRICHGNMEVTLQLWVIRHKDSNQYDKTPKSWSIVDISG